MFFAFSGAGQIGTNGLIGQSKAVMREVLSDLKDVVNETKQTLSDMNVVLDDMERV